MGNAASAGGSTAPPPEPLPGSPKPSPKSWAVTDNSISAPWSFLVKESVMCLCEGGRACTREDPARQQGGNAVPGLHSSWVGEKVLAMARPWQENMLRYDVPSRFAELNIGMVLNLQEVGEHAGCGPGNLPSSGFTYAPEAFMAARIGFYNLSWRDMGVPTLDRMLDIVQVMLYVTAVEGRRVAVHCHAGLGRTGLAIACFLLACGEARDAVDAVERVRSTRVGALQTAAQVAFVSAFEQCLMHLRCVFNVADPRTLKLGNESYYLTRACRRISRSLSTRGPPSGDSLDGALTQLNGISSSSTATATAGNNDDWSRTEYAEMSAAEASKLLLTAAPAPLPQHNNGGARNSHAQQSGLQGVTEAEAGCVVRHARCLSGGPAVKIMSDIRGCTPGSDRPVHVIETGGALTEVYGHGLTIIRAAPSSHSLPTRAACARDAAPPSPPAASKLAPSPGELGLTEGAAGRTSTPWQERFVPRPGVACAAATMSISGTADGPGAIAAAAAAPWHPQPPRTYLEALHRQQRLLHGVERRRSLRLHQLLKAAAAALVRAATQYNSVPWHGCGMPDMAEGRDPQEQQQQQQQVLLLPPPRRLGHSRSRSSAAELPAVVAAFGCGGGMGEGGLGSTAGTRSSGLGSAAGSRSSGLGSTAGSRSSGLGSTAGSRGGWGPHRSVVAPRPAAGSGSSGGHCSADALLPPGVHLGPPGSSAACSAGLQRGSPRTLSEAGAINGRRHTSTERDVDGSSSAAAGRPSVLSLPPSACRCGAGTCCRPASESGCAAPSFATGLLAALLHRGRYPPALEEAWRSCSRVTCLGLGSGYDICSALRAAKLAVNMGNYAAVESARPAIVLPLLADFFAGFSGEALSERTLVALLDEYEPLVAAVDAAEAAAAACMRDAEVERRRSGRLPHGGSSCYSDSSSEVLARRAAARALCCEFAPHERNLLLVLAAVLRHARHASLDDPRLPAQRTDGNQATTSEHRSAAAAAAAAADGSSLVAFRGSFANQPQHNCTIATAAAAEAAAAELSAALAGLCGAFSGWLLGPLDHACQPLHAAVTVYLRYLALDDEGYAQLLQASREAGPRHMAAASTAATTERDEWGHRYTAAPGSIAHSGGGGGSDDGGALGGGGGSGGWGTKWATKLPVIHSFSAGGKGARASGGSNSGDEAGGHCSSGAAVAAATAATDTALANPRGHLQVISSSISSGDAPGEVCTCPVGASPLAGQVATAAAVAPQQQSAGCEDGMHYSLQISSDHHDQHHDQTTLMQHVHSTQHDHQQQEEYAGGGAAGTEQLTPTAALTCRCNSPGALPSLQRCASPGVGLASCSAAVPQPAARGHRAHNTCQQQAPGLRGSAGAGGVTRPRTPGEARGLGAGGSALPSAEASMRSVAASTALSVSALSELQLPSFASTASIADSLWGAHAHTGRGTRG